MEKVLLEAEKLVSLIALSLWVSETYMTYKGEQAIVCASPFLPELKI